MLPEMSVSVAVSSEVAAGPFLYSEILGRKSGGGSNATEPPKDFHLYRSPVDLDHLF